MRKLGWLILIVGACKSYTPVSTVHPAIEETVSYGPKWVDQKPTAPTYYIGVGNAPLSDPNYQANAKLEALDDLSSEISIEIASQSLLHQVENQSGFREQFQSSIQSTTRQSVELHEQVDSWNDGRYYWVQYRLDKYKYQELKESKRQNALSISKQYFERALLLANEGKVMQSLHLYAQCLEVLALYVNEQNTAVVNGGQVYLDLESYTKIVDILSEISLTSDTSSYTFQPYEQKKTIEIQATWEGQNVARLPVKIQKNSSYETITNNEGLLKLSISHREGLQKLTLTPQYDFLRDYPVTYALVGAIQSSSLVIGFDKAEVNVVLTSIEKNLGQPTPQKMLQTVIKEVFTEEGYQVVSDMADYKVEITANTRQGGELSGLFTAYLDFSIDIKNTNGEILFTDSWYNIKGTHTSYPAAGMKAYESIQSNLKTELKSAIYNNFINKN
ncbi:MAG: LPP20 family lipoprotein [Bacteroidota bacterium]